MILRFLPRLGYQYLFSIENTLIVNGCLYLPLYLTLPNWTVSFSRTALRFTFSLSLPVTLSRFLLPFPRVPQHHSLSFLPRIRTPPDSFPFRNNPQSHAAPRTWLSLTAICHWAPFHLHWILLPLKPLHYSVLHNSIPCLSKPSSNFSKRVTANITMCSFLLRWLQAG